MEWANNLQGYSPLEEPLYEFDPAPPPQPLQEPFADQPRVAEWTYQENKMFEDALIEFDISSPNFFENITSKFPNKIVDDIIVHYQALVDDVELIESGRIPVPEYTDSYDEVDEEVAEEEEETDDEMEENENGGDHERKDEEKPKNNGKKPTRKKSVSWTAEEHQLFLMGLNKYGKGDWKSISRYYVITKTPTQVASHAQKFFRRQLCLTPFKKRRPSIHDVKTVNPIPTAMTYPPGSIPNISALMATNNLFTDIPAVPNFIAPTAPIDPNPMFLNPAGFNGTAAFDPNPMFQNPGFNGAATIDSNPMFLNPNINGVATIDSNPMFLNPNINGVAAIDQNPNFLPMPSSSSAVIPYAADDFVNYQNASLAGPSAAPYWFPPYGNNQP